MTSSPKPKSQKSSVTVEWTKAAKAHGLHYPCVSIATVNLLTRIQAEPVPVAQKVKGQKNIKAPFPGASIGPLITNGFVRREDDQFYKVTWKGDFYIKQLKEAGLI